MTMREQAENLVAELSEDQLKMAIAALVLVNKDPKRLALLLGLNLKPNLASRLTLGHS